MGSRRVLTLDSVFLFGVLWLEPDACSPRFMQPHYLILSSPFPQLVVTAAIKDCEAWLKQEVVSPQGVGSGVTCGVLVSWEPVWTWAPLFRAGDRVGRMGHQQSPAGPAPGARVPSPPCTGPRGPWQSGRFLWATLRGRSPPALWGRRAGPRTLLARPLLFLRRHTCGLLPLSFGCLKKETMLLKT